MMFSPLVSKVNQSRRADSAIHGSYVDTAGWRVAQALDFADRTNKAGCPVLAFFARAGTMLLSV